MLSSVLRSPRAIQVSIAIVRTFVRFRQLLAAHEEIASKLEDLEWRRNEQGQQIQVVFETIEELMTAGQGNGPEAPWFPVVARERSREPYLILGQPLILFWRERHNRQASLLYQRRIGKQLVLLNVRQ